jgi:PH (Pleckstrin Homology) domain-containing protein/putative oligomerization/nucleic acid binding protein
MSQSVETQPAAADATAEFASLLASGERVLVVRRRHWATFVQAARWFALVLVAGLLVALLWGEAPNGGTFGFVGTGLGWGFAILVVAGLAGVGWYYLEWRRERYLVTTRRVIEAGGVINKWQRDTSLQMITDMIVGHPWLGRILGYGEIDLLTASEAGTNKIRFLPDADGFKKTLLDAKYEHELEVGGGARATAPAPAPAPAAAPAPERLSADEVDASISHLASMRDRGLITAGEFEEKKREILDRL